VLKPRWIADAAARLHATDGDGHDTRQRELRRQLARHDKAIANLVAMAEETDDVRELSMRLRERRDERASLERELAVLAAETLPVPWMRDVEAVRERLRGALRAGNRRAVKEVVAMCVESITVEAPDRWRVHWRGAG
jgi:hypothetical protein